MTIGGGRIRLRSSVSYSTSVVSLIMLADLAPVHSFLCTPPETPQARSSAAITIRLRQCARRTIGLRQLNCPSGRPTSGEPSQLYPHKT